jgi:hypothetical protein
MYTCITNFPFAGLIDINRYTNVNRDLRKIKKKEEEEELNDSKCKISTQLQLLPLNSKTSITIVTIHSAQNRPLIKFILKARQK